MNFQDLFGLMVLSAVAAVLEHSQEGEEANHDANDEIRKYYHHHGIHSPSASARCAGCALHLLQLQMQIRVNAVAMSTIEEAFAEDSRQHGIDSEGGGNGSCNSMAVVTLEQRRVGLGLFLRTAMLNHSHSPNAVLQFEFGHPQHNVNQRNRRQKDSDEEDASDSDDECADEACTNSTPDSDDEDGDGGLFCESTRSASVLTGHASVRVVATEDIPTGTEIFISYAKPAGHTAKAFEQYRQKMLEQYGFNVAADAAVDLANRSGGADGIGGFDLGRRRSSSGEDGEGDGANGKGETARSVTESSMRVRERARSIARDRQQQADDEDAKAKACASAGNFALAAKHCRRALGHLLEDTAKVPSLYRAGDVELIPEYFKLAQLLFNAGPSSAPEALEAVEEALRWAKGLAGVTGTQQEMCEELELMQRHLREFMAMGSGGKRM
jgi:hypothetical protein